MARVIFGFAGGRVSGEIGCDLFNGAFAEVLRLATLYRAESVWCRPVDIWEWV